MLDEQRTKRVLFLSCLCLFVFFVVVLLREHMSEVLAKRPPKVCCSCVCRTDQGKWCGGLAAGSFVSADCRDVCARACSDKGCVLKNAGDLPQDRCSDQEPFL